MGPIISQSRLCHLDLFVPHSAEVADPITSESQDWRPSRVTVIGFRQQMGEDSEEGAVGRDQGETHGRMSNKGCGIKFMFKQGCSVGPTFSDAGAGSFNE